MVRPAKAKKYKCINKCWFKLRIFDVGDEYVPKDADEEIPEHFVPSDEYCEELVEEAALKEMRKTVTIVDTPPPANTEAEKV